MERLRLDGVDVEIDVRQSPASAMLVEASASPISSSWEDTTRWYPSARTWVRWCPLNLGRRPATSEPQPALKRPSAGADTSPAALGRRRPTDPLGVET
jgi:hypothetical protein